MFNDQLIISILKEHYSINVSSVRRLQGESDINFLCISPTSKYTLKLSSPETPVEELKFQIEILQHVQATKCNVELPTPIIATDKSFFKKIYIESSPFNIRLQTWVEGNTINNLIYHCPSFLQQWGIKAAELNLSLSKFNHPYSKRTYKWNPSETLDSKSNLAFIKSDEEKEIAIKLWDRFENKTLAILPRLKKQINHNDLHDMNLLISGTLGQEHITGVIDFGDAIYTERINELAIVCAYAMMHKEDPIEAAFNIITGYNSIIQIDELEIEHLFNLICARLLITVASSAENKCLHPENEYLLISEKPAWELLRKIVKINPSFIHYRFRTACGLTAHPNEKLFKEWATSNKNKFFPILGEESKVTKNLDLSVSSTILGNTSNYLEIEQFNKQVFRYLEDENIQLGVGGYSEIRPFYTTDSYRIMGNEGAMWRTMHLGLDFWIAANTEVFAPLPGTVHSIYNNEGDCDYGPTIILKHYFEDQEFYTLYGHLSEESLQINKVGEKIKQGTKIANIGNYPINGNWPPHLHFQIMLDLLGNTHDFPGVAYVHESVTWLSICPNPDLLVNLQVDTKPKLLAESNSIIKNRKNLIGKGLSISYKNPLQIVRGHKQYLYDQLGRRYLDTVNNVAHVGHEHKSLIKVAQNQIGLLNTNTRYLNSILTEYAAKLLNTFPPELSVVHFVNSGSEANELALRMAKTISEGTEIVAIEIGYHGNTGNTIDVSSYKFDGQGGNGKPKQTHVLPLPDTYRMEIPLEESPSNFYTKNLEAILQSIENSDKKLAGFIGESILSCGGQIVLPKNYFSTIYKKIREYNGLCIADEVQTGFGRIGSNFWAFQSQNVIPDIVTIGKPIGNGHPIGAVVTTRAVADQFANGMEYFNTFGGNPVSCAIGKEVIQIIKREKLQENALKIGDLLTKELKKLQLKFPLIGDVRGMGLFLGIELVQDQISKRPAIKETDYIVNRMRERGILMSSDGPYHNVLKIKPPMCFSEENVVFLINNLELVLSEITH